MTVGHLKNMIISERNSENVPKLKSLNLRNMIISERKQIVISEDCIRKSSIDFIKLNDMIMSERYGGVNIISSRDNITPIYFERNEIINSDDFHDVMIDVSSFIWVSYGYSGLMNPWHDNDPKRMLSFQDSNVKKFIATLNDMDINLWSYCMLSACISDYNLFERPMLLYGQRSHWSWIRKLRKYVGGSVDLDNVAKFVNRFIELQVEHKGKAIIKSSNVVGVELDGKGKLFSLYHKISDRIKQLSTMNIDFLFWLERKFKACVKMNSNDQVYINTVVNHNGLDPDVKELLNIVKDPWNEIREFLGLSNECEFPDGFIPKGWMSTGNMLEKTVDIIKITADGFYYLKDGTQRKGKRHYANNKFLVIKCNPSNFKLFVDDWHKDSMVTARPTWEEYKNWALYDGFWDEGGIGINDMAKNIRWRKK